MKSLRILFGCLICLMLYALGFAAVPTLVNFQGRLTESLGNPRNASFSMTFKIYDASSGGNVLWQETNASVTTTNGVFNVLLGSVTPVPDTAFKDTSRWLGVTVEADPEIAPRARLTSSPYAFRVNTIDGATGGAVGGDIQMSGIVYSSTGGFKFPDGSVQTSASPGSFFQNTFRYFGNISSGPPVIAFTVPNNKTRYITGIFVSGRALPLLVRISGSPVIQMWADIGGSTYDAFWFAGGGAPILVQQNETLELSNGGSSAEVLITGFEF